ncbi:MAG: DUF2075 domain-containing protein [Candidatus Marinimicrobia bacterium]|nr:DUF2075 domain-containing protein [Candidatus Neomarinimicrobiota bacterium]
MSNQVTIQRFDFKPQLIDQVSNNHYARDLWPIVYLLSDGQKKLAYVGETADTSARMNAHLNHSQKNKLSDVHLIMSEMFNKSATLDIESNLIQYLTGDGEYQLLNGNLGLANHNYFQKNEVYRGIFKEIWDKLRAQGITKHSLEHIDNSDLYKYSPYKALSADQKAGLQSIILALTNNEHRNVLVKGGAGTGKTILAIFLFKILHSNDLDFIVKETDETETQLVQAINDLKSKYPQPKMALVVPMSSFRETLKKVFRNIDGLKASMVIGPAEASKRTYDILVVDEAHRLRRRVNLGTYFGAFDNACKRLGLDPDTASELDWVIQQSEKSLLFYDEAQSIKPSDTLHQNFITIMASKQTLVETLKSQFRVKAGNDYVDFVNKLLACALPANANEFVPSNYEFVLFDSITEMVAQIKQKDETYGLSRLIAGFAWPWISKNDKTLYDIQIGSKQLQWNGDSIDWINTPNSVNEVGCIHTTQGYDLNYAGIIFGNEISYDKQKNEIIIRKENYHDKNGKQSIVNPDELKAFIINIYKTIMLRGIQGTYIYACDPNLQEYLARYIPLKESTRTPKEVQYIPIEEVQPFINAIPLYNLNVAAGQFGAYQKVEDISWIMPPVGRKASKNLFACKVVGESMNKIIPDGSICLFSRYTGGSRNGKIVIVEHTDLQDAEYGSCYTIKEYESQKSQSGDEWEHASIRLIPRSTDPRYLELLLHGDETVSLRVIGVFECVL